MTPPHPLHATVGDVELAFPYEGPRQTMARLDQEWTSIGTCPASKHLSHRWIAQDVEEFNASLARARQPAHTRQAGRIASPPRDRQEAFGVPTYSCYGFSRHSRAADCQSRMPFQNPLAGFDGSDEHDCRLSISVILAIRSTAQTRLGRASLVFRVRTHAGRTRQESHPPRPPCRRLRAPT